MTVPATQPEIMQQPPAVVPRVSAVMPCLNEERTLEACIRKAQASFARLGVAGEVVIADNGSTDRSRELAAALGARVILEQVKGYGAAVAAGVNAARGEIIVIADSDESYDWSDLGRFVEKIEQGYDLVNGNRFKGGIEPGAMPWLHKYFGNPVLSLLSRIVFGAPINDFHCGMRAFTRRAWDVMALKTMGFETCTEMIGCAARKGLRMTEIPIRLYPDGRDRKPHLRSFRDGWVNLRFILTFAPDQLYLFPGALMLIAGALLQGALVRGPVLILGHYFLGIHFLALGGLLTVIGFNVILLGLITKVLLSQRYSKLRTPLVEWTLGGFRLEQGLMAGATLTVAGGGYMVWLLVQWLAGNHAAMDASVHPAFVAANAIALGINLLFASFMLNLLSRHHADSN